MRSMTLAIAVLAIAVLFVSDAQAQQRRTLITPLGIAASGPNGRFVASPLGVLIERNQPRVQKQIVIQQKVAPAAVTFDNRFNAYGTRTVVDHYGTVYEQDAFGSLRVVLPAARGLPAVGASTFNSYSSFGAVSSYSSHAYVPTVSTTVITSKHCRTGLLGRRICR